ncbi:response regulator [Sphingomonas oligophenolica]|uniref:Response regulator n=1 Tax=Sphingomonas oligophenolica TaxID=301154 RepID=A0A502CLB7_9SPHN|nr:response regulator [Sphingomonas oligophenolica]TPG13623.1 response regulator [Sphingomonas oligophenolica]
MTDRQARSVTQLAEAPQCILVVEDEVLIRFVIADYLRDCGYHVMEAADATEAVALLQVEAAPIDLVFSDVQMPGEMDGFGLAHWVRANRPGLPVILTSGNARTADLGEQLCEIGPVETKPYDAASLVTRMQTLLARAAATGVDKGLGHWS